MEYILTNYTLTFLHQGKPHSLHKDQAGDRTWDRALEALEAQDVDALLRLTDTAGQLINYTDGQIEIKSGRVYLNGVEIDTYPARKAVEFMRENLPFTPILRFIERLQANPSRRAVHDLYQFLEHGQIPLTSDGHFVAYKKVRRNPDGNLVDIFTGTFNNNPGTIVEMPRNQVDEDPDQTCSFGLHICAHGYLGYYGSGTADAVIAVKVDPADVVAIPRDYNNSKMRVSKYEVIEIVEEYEKDPLKDSPLHDELYTEWQNAVASHATDMGFDEWVDYQAERD